GGGAHVNANGIETGAETAANKGRGATLWGGRFTGTPDPRFQAFQSSLAVDRRLAREDLEGSRAWARALERAGVLAPSERTALERGLAAIGAELARDPGMLATSDAEDVHSFVEARLGEIVG